MRMNEMAYSTMTFNKWVRLILPLSLCFSVSRSISIGQRRGRETNERRMRDFLLRSRNRITLAAADCDQWIEPISISI